MDKRMALPVGWELQFPGLKCVTEEEIGRGSNAIVYRGWYEDASNARQHHPVLIKELFPYQENGGIYRDPQSGHIQITPEGAPVMQMHQDSFRWGNDIHLQMKAMHPEETGANINTYAYQGTYYTLLGFSGGRTLDAELSRQKEASTLRRIVQRCVGVLDSLKAFHQMDFLHLDISPDNVILLNRGRRERVELIDYNSVIRLCDLAEGTPIHLSRKQGYASPEVRKGDLGKIGPWTDLYSVAALFYFCLMETPLTRMQLSGIAPVSVQTSRFLSGVPATVTAQVQKILAKGLAASVKRRYQSITEMLEEFQELLNRIDGIGITHWALWETCADSVRREIGGNTGLAYLTEEASLYPLELSDAQGMPVPSLLSRNSNAVLTGSGGMGKTTLFLRTAWLESQHYRPDRSVVCYISLNDYSPGDDTFLHDKILRKMRFSADTVTYENARHTLDLLLQKPLMTKQGAQPMLYLLLDGYNEISWDPQGLHREILRFSQMDGVTVLIASRNGLPEYPFEQWTVEPLKKKTVQEILGNNGLLVPEEPKIRVLLHNPMMLNLFVRACLSEGSQLKVEDGKGLIYAYLRAITDKELRAMPEDARESWQIRAAVEGVLPLIAGIAQGQTLSNELLITHISRLYAALNGSLLRKHFPSWIGHFGDIRGNCAQAEDWYRLMVQDILWRRLGLLVRDAEGQYRIFHQEFQETLAPQGKALAAELQRKSPVRRILGAVLGTAAAAAIAVGGFFLMEQQPWLPRVEIDRKALTTSRFLVVPGQYEYFTDLNNALIRVPYDNEAETFYLDTGEVIYEQDSTIEGDGASGLGEAENYLYFTYFGGAGKTDYLVTMDFDGTNQKQLFSMEYDHTTPDYVKFSDGSEYFYYVMDDGAEEDGEPEFHLFLYRYNVQTGQTEQVLEEEIGAYFMYGKYLYYLRDGGSGKSDHYDLYRSTLTGKDHTLLDNEVHNYIGGCVIDDQLYLIQQHNSAGSFDIGLIACDEDGKPLEEGKGVYIVNYANDIFTIGGGWLFYNKAGTSDLYRIRLDGTSNEKILSGYQYEGLTYSENQLFFIDGTYLEDKFHPYQAYVTATDGSWVAQCSFDLQPMTDEQGCQYVIEDGMAKIVGYTGRETDVILPLEFNGYPFNDSVNWDEFHLENVDRSDLRFYAAIPETDLTWKKDKNGITITGYSGMKTGAFGGVAIPTEIDGLPVRRIDDKAFAECTFSAVYLPKKLEEIGSEAFDSCTRLDHVIFPDTLKTIGKYAFFKCPFEGEDIVIPDSVETLGTGFLANASPNSVKLPASLSTLDNSFLVACGGEYIVAEDHKRLKAVDGVVMSKDGSVLYAFPSDRTGSYQMPDTVTTIEHGAFWGSELTTVFLPDGLTTIEGNAFRYCEKLVAIRIPASVTALGKEAFCNSGIKVVTIRKGTSGIKDAFEEDVVFLYDEKD